MKQYVIDKNRNMGLDFLKYLCAFLVICIHTDFPGEDVVEPLARIAVPVFFMITGYHYTYICSRNKAKDQIVKILRLTVYANILYFLWSLLVQFGSTGSVLGVFMPLLEVRTWLIFIFLNESPFSYRLWYLGALLYVLIIAALAERRNMRQKLYGLIPILFVCNYLLGNYSVAVFGKVIPLYYSKNFLFVGLPCFLLGDFLFGIKDKKRFGNKFLISVLIVSGILTLVEDSFLKNRWSVYNKDLFISTMFTAVSLFMLANNNARLFHSGILYRIAVWGRELSMGIYIYNNIVRMIIFKSLELVSGRLPILEQVANCMSPFVVLFATSLTVWCMNRIKLALHRNRCGSAAH